MTAAERARARAHRLRRGAPPAPARRWRTRSPIRPASCCCRCARCARQADPVLARNRRALFGFRDADHGDGRADSLAWLDELLAGEGIADADGEVWLHCIPRMFGYRVQAGQLLVRAPRRRHAGGHRRRGQQHLRRAPLLPARGRRRSASAARWRATKVFHVSPFCQTRGEYRFRFMRTDLAARDACGRTAVRVELHVDGAPLLLTSVSRPHRAADARQRVRCALWTLPAMTRRRSWRASTGRR